MTTGKQAREQAGRGTGTGCRREDLAKETERTSESEGPSVEKAVRKPKEKKKPEKERIILATHCGTFP